MDGVELSASVPEPPAPKRGSFTRDAGLTMATQFIVALATLVQYRLIRNWGVEDLAGYSQVFRNRNVLEWIVLIVLPTALVREIAGLRAREDHDGARVFVWTGIAMATVFVLIFVGIVNLAPGASAAVLLGSEKMGPWMSSYGILLAGYSACLIVMALLRGSMLFRHANLLLLTYTGIFPVLAAFLGHGHSILWVIDMTGRAALATAAFFLMPLLMREPRSNSPIWAGAERHRKAAASLIHYGAPRLLTLGCVAVLTLALPWLVERNGDRPLLAAVNAVFLVIGAMAILISPMGFVLLPHLSALVAKGEYEQAGRQLSVVLEFTLFVGGGASLLALGLMRFLLTHWLGPQVGDFPQLMVAACFAVPSFLILEILRSPLDAASRTPWNAVTYGTGACLTIGTFQTLSTMGMGLDLAVAWSMVAGFGAAAAVALILAHRLYQLSVSRSKLVLPLIAWALGIGCLLWERSVLGEAAAEWSTLAVGLAYAACALVTKPRWAIHLTPARFKGAGGAG